MADNGADGYENRLNSLSQDQIEKINSQQNPNQKQALIDDDPDLVDELFIDESGFVVVPDEVRIRRFSQNPSSFRTDQSQRSVSIGTSVDSTNITVINKNMKLTVRKISENDDEIRFNVMIQNNDNNCLVIDSISQIAGTDLSKVDPETKISEDEKILKGVGAGPRIITDKTIVTEFIKKYTPNYETLQSSIGNIPFDVELPDFLDQVDARSLALCPKNSGVVSNTEDKQQVSKKGNLLPIQLEVINEALKWNNFQETGNDNSPSIKLRKTGDNSYDPYTDLSLIELMKKYQKYEAGNRWCAAYAHSIIGLAASRINHPIEKAITSGILNKGVEASYIRAKSNGLLVPHLVPGCAAYGQDIKDPSKRHCILILEVRRILNKPGYAFDCVTIEGNSSTEGNIPTKYKNGVKACGLRRSQGFGGRIFTKRGNDLYFGNLRFLGCSVPKDVQEYANGDYSIFISEDVYY